MSAAQSRGAEPRGSGPLEALVGLSQRLPPANLQAEQALLGALLANNRAYDRVAGFLLPEHFADSIHGRVYQAVGRRVDKGELADPVTLRAEFEHSHILDDAGGVGYLAELLSAMVGIINAGEYGKAIYDAWIRRTMIDIGETLVNNAFGAAPEVDARELVAKASDSMLALLHHAERRQPVTITIDRAIDMAIEAAEARQAGRTPPAVATGFAELDDLMGGMEPGDLILLVGAQGSGKTILAQQIAYRAAKRWRDEAGLDRVPTAAMFFSFEMRAEQLGARQIAMESTVQTRTVTRLRWDDDTAAQVAAMQRASRRVPLIVETEGRSLQAIERRARMLRRGRPLGLIVIDHLGKIARDRRGDFNYEGHDSATAGLKDLAKDLQVPVLLLLHPKLSALRRDDTSPQIGDVPYGVDKHADVVLALHRPERFLLKSPPKKTRQTEESYAAALSDWHAEMDSVRGTADLVPLKMRNGDEDWTVRLAFEKDHTRFADRRRDQPPVWPE